MATSGSGVSKLGLYISTNTPWNKLPPSIKEELGHVNSIYEKAVVEYSISNQLVWRQNLVRQIYKNERKYYEEILQHCQTNLMLYPYHLQDQFVQGLKVTPFEYYHSICETIMVEQKSYDSLPNFTARDCYRLLGIGRNEYIDIMNRYRSKRFWRRRSPSEFLPSAPLQDILIQPWWLINVGYVTEEEIERCTQEEHNVIDSIINNGAKPAGYINKTIIRNLFTRQLVYFVIPVSDSDYIVVPPLQGFVMNRVSGDYFETLLYKVFVTINEHTQVSELANVLQINLQEVKNAIAVFIRLGFAYKKSVRDSSLYDDTWKEEESTESVEEEEHLVMQLKQPELEMEDILSENFSQKEVAKTLKSFSPDQGTTSESGFKKRIGFLFDSTLTAFLMMGNLSPGLKNHAVTMFEVGKLTDEVLDDFLTELDKVGNEPEGEGEAQRYFQHAVILRNTIQFLRYNSKLSLDDKGLGMDLLHCESMSKLDSGTLNRLLEKNYCVCISMAPLSQEVQSLSVCYPPHIGPALPEMNSIWFKLWLYHKLQCGPQTILLTRGTRLTKLPKPFKSYRKLLLTSWGHDTAIINTSNALLTINEALTHSPVLLQAQSWRSSGKMKHVPFPFKRDSTTSDDDIVQHPALSKLESVVDMRHSCGYITMLYTGLPVSTSSNNSQKEVERNLEISEFLEDLRELGIGDPVAVVTPPTITINEEPPVIKEHLEWVPLELCFGIPLFDSEANREVCDKIVSCNLFAENNLKLLIQSNRLLVMEVMEFISAYQDLDVYSHTSTRSGSVPLPSRSLMFIDNNLTSFIHTI